MNCRTFPPNPRTRGRSHQHHIGWLQPTGFLDFFAQTSAANPRRIRMDTRDAENTVVWCEAVTIVQCLTWTSDKNLVRNTTFWSCCDLDSRSWSSKLATTTKNKTKTNKKQQYKAKGGNKETHLQCKYKMASKLTKRWTMIHTQRLIHTHLPKLCHYL